MGCEERRATAVCWEQICCEGTLQLVVLIGPKQVTQARSLEYPNSVQSHSLSFCDQHTAQPLTKPSGLPPLQDYLHCTRANL